MLSPVLTDPNLLEKIEAVLEARDVKLSLRLEPGDDMLDDEMTILCGDDDTGVAFQVGHGEISTTKWDGDGMVYLYTGIDVLDAVASAIETLEADGLMT